MGFYVYLSHANKFAQEATIGVFAIDAYSPSPELTAKAHEHITRSSRTRGSTSRSPTNREGTINRAGGQPTERRTPPDATQVQP
jgi:hypothetical protein